MNKIKILVGAIYIIVVLSIIWLMDRFSPYRSWALTATIFLYLAFILIYNSKQKKKNK